MTARRHTNPLGQYSIDFSFDEADDTLLAKEPEEQYDACDKLYYISFGSGSSGNSCYLGNDKGGIIIDAGIKDSDVEKVLEQNGVRMTQVKAILLTHDHADHVRYVYKLLRSNKHIRLFCTNRVIGGMLRRTSISKRVKDYHNPIFKEIPFKVHDFQVTAFEVPHDGSDNMGFYIEYKDKRFVIATDMGEVQPRARHYISLANYLVIETNYDADMLRLGKYPEHLKARIRTSQGHMDNKDTAAFLKEIIAPHLKHIFLCHLSNDNNTPQIARDTVKQALEEAGKSIGNGEDTLEDRKCDVQLTVLPRYEATRWYAFL